MDNTEKQILDELRESKAELAAMKSHLTLVDLVVTDDDLESVRKAEEDLKAKRTKTLI